MTRRKSKRSEGEGLVPCYPLASVIGPDMWALVAPFARATFTETWEACVGDPDGIGGTCDGYPAREALRAAATEATPIAPFWYQNDGARIQCTPGEGRAIEAALYALAVSRNLPSILAAPRGAR